MLKPDKAIEKELREYDPGLYAKWNNAERYWEIWHKRPSVDQLITPVVESIYVDGGDAFRYAPLDGRIISWLYSADKKRVDKNWKWIARKRYDARISRQSRITREKFANIAKDNYNLINNELLNEPMVDTPTWLAPDKVHGRVGTRSAENAIRRRGQNELN